MEDELNPIENCPVDILIDKLFDKEGLTFSDLEDLEGHWYE